MRLAIVVATLFLVGCQYDPFAHEFTKTQPKEPALIGRYVPVGETTARLRTSLGVTISPHAALVVNADHTFVATELPNCWITPAMDCAPGTETWAGTWSLQPDQEWWAVELHIRVRNGEPTSYRMPAMLRGEAPPYLVHLTIGDPDMGDALAFERR